MSTRRAFIKSTLLPATAVAAGGLGQVFAFSGEDNAAQYPKTIEALQQRYADEVLAHRKYNAYVGRAEEEDYPRIAHLFRSLAASEGVHARNFKRILNDLGVEAGAPAQQTFEVLSTKENIRDAATVEVEEIDEEYPDIIKMMAPESHGEAILFTTYAWEAEKMHRDLILSIQKASGGWFSFLARRIEAKPRRYYVCKVCGATVTELPGEVCPVCGRPVSEYYEVPGFPVLLDDAKESRTRDRTQGSDDRR